MREASPPNQAGVPHPGPTWIAAAIEARQRALESAAPDARTIAAIRLARAQAWSGQDGAAVRLLISERRALRPHAMAAEIARLELGLGELALIADDEDRAAVHLEQAREAAESDQPARRIVAGWIAARRGAQRPLVELPNAPLTPWIAELLEALLLEFAWTPSALPFDGEELRAHVRGADVRSRALVDLPVAVAREDRESTVRALRSLERAGLSRDLGRAVLRTLAAAPQLLADAKGSTTPWIALAQSSLAESGTWRDRVAVRHAWRSHGRRDADRALPRDVATKLDARDRVRAHVQSSLAIGLDRQLRSLEELELALTESPSSPGVSVEVHDALDGLHDAIDLLDAAAQVALSELGRSEGDLTQLVAATFAERERARAMARVLTDLEASDDVESLLSLLARVVAEQVGASAVVIAERIPRVGLRASATFGIDEGDDAWIEIAERAIDRPIGTETQRERDRRAGGSDAPLATPTLVVTMRAMGTDGAIYVDKRGGNGSAFSAADQAALEMLASYGGIALGRLRATATSASIGRRLAATMDAMRDGVLAIDESGEITAVNEPAARTLRFEAARLLGRRLDGFADLAPLAAVLAAAERPDGVVVRLPQTSVVVTAREVEGEGIVATLVEYERAQKMAQKLVGGRTRYTFGDLRGNDPALRQALEMARRAAAVDASVLIVGESGTGKELLAQAIHAGGPRAREPFVAINCAALPRDLLEAELFGYERGAFTGARAEGSVGKFELAGDGTILLDEIVDLPLDMQAKLLRVLQERVVVRLGSNVERPVRARVLATAQRDLSIDVERGRFRLDLLHRLRVLQIQLPPLRQRPGDVLVIAQHYLRQFAERQGKAVREISREVESALVGYGWPGNVRELANVIEGEVSLLTADATVLDRVPSAIVARTVDAPASGTFSLRDSMTLTAAAGSIIPLAEVERRAYLDAYEKSGRSVTRAARALGVSKVTFYGKLRQFGMHPSEVTGEIPMMRSTGRMPVAPAIEPMPSSVESDPPGYDDRPPESLRDPGYGPIGTKPPPSRR
jgi:transcriptional regulator with PAS, ATPase and Fis domain